MILIGFSNQNDSIILTFQHSETADNILIPTACFPLQIFREKQS